MARSLAEVERDARALTGRERAQLLQALIRDLDAPFEDNVDGAWLEEAERRLDRIEAGDVTPLAGADVIAEAKARLK
jgi:hypothetical protein